MDREAFDTYIETQFAPGLSARKRRHPRQPRRPQKPARKPAGLKHRGSWFLYLPKYFPDLNPIEKAFAKLKAHFRRIGARTFDPLMNALGDICNLFTPQECWNFLKDAGYASD